MVAKQAEYGAQLNARWTRCATLLMLPVLWPLLRQAGFQVRYRGADYGHVTAQPAQVAIQLHIKHILNTRCITPSPAKTLHHKPSPASRHHPMMRGRFFWPCQRDID